MNNFLKRLELAVTRIDSSLEDAQDFLSYQSDKMNWEAFKFKCLQRHSKFNDGNICTDYAEWIEHQKSNTLSNSSSGSFFTALADFDNIIGCDEFSVNVYDTAYEYYRIIRKSLKL